MQRGIANEITMEYEGVRQAEATTLLVPQPSPAAAQYVVLPLIRTLDEEEETQWPSTRA